MTRLLWHAMFAVMELFLNQNFIFGHCPLLWLKYPPPSFIHKTYTNFRHFHSNHDKMEKLEKHVPPKTCYFLINFIHLYCITVSVSDILFFITVKHTHQHVVRSVCPYVCLCPCVCPRPPTQCSLFMQYVSQKEPETKSDHQQHRDPSPQHFIIRRKPCVLLIFLYFTCICDELTIILFSVNFTITGY